jgi:hypothetical protein
MEDVTVVEKRLYDEISAVVGNAGLSISNLTAVVIALMKVVEDPVWKLSGSDKKALVIKILNKYVEEKIDNDQIEAIIESMIPPLIDSIVDVATGVIQVKLKSCLASICGC